jgi:small subunit ribosomal protein S9
MPTQKTVKPKKVVEKKPVAIKKKVVAAIVSDIPAEPAVIVSGRYVYAVGRRKTAVARVRLYPSAQAEETVVNKKSIREYFGTAALEAVALSPLKTVGLIDAFHVSVVTRGSGLHSQAGAIKLGIARCLIKHDPLLRVTLKAMGFLTRDAREVERKKPGLKKARRAPQWAKR